MGYWEIVLKGFDGSTDKTDDKIIWIKIPNDMEIELDPKSDVIESISDIDIKYPDGFDLTVTDKKYYINHYECSRCGTKWEDRWDCMCNDRCPKCNIEIEPYYSDREHKNERR